MMTVEKFDLKLIKKIALVFALSERSRQSTEYLRLVSLLNTKGGEEISPGCFLIAGAHKIFVNDLGEYLDFMEDNDSLLVFNGLEIEAGATFWLPQKIRPSIRITE
ncbi:hypothetical protein [Yoonia sp. I 8.24]|uniref:hypothetical protein n=1 Tax=Yoonia sp. I 8.24 TaxID=1537229 RepID=UPI001EDF9AC9|nr:hypothetical protein [Yoonia sp. I 8.24]MCG3266589.1 hypothetical protein [Yoonia sp. I 8.24]